MDAGTTMTTATATTTTTTTTSRAKHHKPKARAHGEGSVCFERGTGKWVAVVSLGQVNGGRKRKKLRFDTQAEARLALTRLTKALDDGMGASDDRMTVKRFLTKWLAECVEGPLSSLRIATRVSYASLVNGHLVPGLGHHVLSKLSALHVQSFLSSKLTAGLSPRTAQYLHAVLRSALKQAERWGCVSRNVAKLVDAPTVPQREAASLTTEQAGKLLAVVDDNRLRALFSVAVAMGLRRGEIVGLPWANVDLETGTLRVRQQLQRVKKKGLVVSDLKTDKSRRTLKIPGAVLEELKEHRRQQLAERLKAGPLWTETGFVFTNSKGGALDGREVLKTWQAACLAAKLPSMPFHASRHTAGSFLLAQGADLRTVMGVLGHSQIALTANTYAHMLEELHDSAAARSDAALTAARASVGR